MAELSPWNKFEKNTNLKKGEAVLSRQADNTLIEIYEYYRREVSEETALRIINRILDAIEELERLPGIGSIELRLQKLQLDYRYIVVDSYKVIYRLEHDIIYINDIFDGRQDPHKIDIRNK
jgi:plasmid stabilization system protein ParE